SARGRLIRARHRVAYGCGANLNSQLPTPNSQGDRAGRSPCLAWEVEIGRWTFQYRDRFFSSAYLNFVHGTSPIFTSAVPVIFNASLRKTNAMPMAPLPPAPPPRRPALAG